jgi:hypothetical protein
MALAVGGLGPLTFLPESVNVPVTFIVSELEVLIELCSLPE